MGKTVTSLACIYYAKYKKDRRALNIFKCFIEKQKADN